MRKIVSIFVLLILGITCSVRLSFSDNLTTPEDSTGSIQITSDDMNLEVEGDIVSKSKVSVKIPDGNIKITIGEQQTGSCENDTKALKKNETKLDSTDDFLSNIPLFASLATIFALLFAWLQWRITVFHNRKAVANAILEELHHNLNLRDGNIINKMNDSQIRSLFKLMRSKFDINDPYYPNPTD